MYCISSASNPQKYSLINSYLYHSAEPVTLVHGKQTCRIWIAKEHYKVSETPVVKYIFYHVDDKESCIVSHLKMLHPKNGI